MKARTLAVAYAFGHTACVCFAIAGAGLAIYASAIGLTQLIEGAMCCRESEMEE
jgi:hypothetical protein